MAAARAELAKGTEEKARPRPPQGAEGEAPQKAKPAESQGLKAWLPLGVAVVAMPVLAYLTTSFVLVPKMQKALVASGLGPAESAKETKSEGGSSEKKGEGSGGAHQHVILNKLLVNVAGTMGSRYLLTSVTLMGKRSDLAAKVAQSEPQLRDMACGLLSAKTIVDLEKPGARNVLRGELIAGCNNILGSGAVQEIYFTEFSIQ
jgi:flagellar FliL protein